MDDSLVGVSSAALFLLVLIVSFAVRKTPEGATTRVGRRTPRAGVPESFVVFDLETTGLDTSRDEIIEIGAIRVTDIDADVHTWFQTLVKSGMPVPKEATQLTGISQEMLDRDGVPLETAVRGFLEFAGELPLVAFNAKFDMAVLRRSARKCGITVSNPSSCALKKARSAWPGLPCYRLSYLAEQAGLSAEDTHRALGDCKRTLILYAAAGADIYQRARLRRNQRHC